MTAIILFVLESCDEDIVKAVNEVVKLKGGLAVSSEERLRHFSLKIAGIMSDQSCEECCLCDMRTLTQRVKVIWGVNCQHRL